MPTGGRSARRRSRGGLEGAPASKRRRRTAEWIDSAFGRAVEPAGMVLSDGSDHNKLTVEPVEFQRKLSALFRRHPNTEQAVGEFTEGLKRYTEDSVRFRQSLLPTDVAEGADVMLRSGGLDSLMRQLLSVNYLQPSVAHLLLLRLGNYMDTASSHSMNMKELCQMPALILNQLRWLDHIVKGQDLCRELLEVVGVAPVEIQREIVTAIPEILDDAQHNNAATKLKSLLQNNPSLMAATIDALSSLNLSSDIEAEVLDVAMNCLGSASVSDLPLVLKFIIQQVTSKNGLEIIGEVREKLDLESSFLSPPAACSTPRSSQRASSRMSSEVTHQFMVFDVLSSSIRFQKPVADGWIKSIEAVSEQSDHKVIDIFVLFVLHSLPARKKSVETLFTTKVRSQLFTDDLLMSTFGPHAKVLSDFFPSVLSLCEFLLTSSSPTVASFTTSLYLHLFSTFDIYCRQEVIGTLVTHIGSGMPAEVDRALEILATLVDSRRSDMNRFAILIKGVLDYLEHLNIRQIRRLYSILSVLAFHDIDMGSGVQDEMHTLIRKQLSHVEAKYRRMGVVGAVMIIQQLGKRRDAVDMSLRLTGTTSQMSSQVESTLPPGQRRQAISMLDDVMRSCSRSPDSTILFCDEMASALQSLPLDHSLLLHLCEQTTTVFQDTYLVEVSDTLPTDLGLPLELVNGLDSSEEGSIAVNLFPLVVKEDERRQERGSILRGMAAQFRLLRICEQILNNSLEGIDALLGAPVVMCVRDRLEKEIFEDLPLPKRQSICLSLCHCLNWYRELVCAFSRETDTDMRGKVVIRLRNITEMEMQLESCMTGTPGFLPPQVMAEEVKVTIKPRRGKRLGSKGDKGDKNDTTMANATTTVITQNVDKDSTVVEKTAGAPVVSLALYRPYFREMDLGVFSVLSYEPISRTLLDTDMHTSEREELKLLPRQLSFLLHDLSVKLSSSLSHFASRSLTAGQSRSRSTSGGGGGGGGKIQLFTVDELVATTAGLVSCLCEHLENTSGFFQAQLEENDGIEDMESSHADHPLHCTNLDLLLKSMATFFAWPHLTDPHYSEQLYTALTSLASRIDRIEHTASSSLPHLAQLSHRYLEQFSSSLPSLSSAHLLAKLMISLGKTSPLLHPLIANSCQSLLQKKWAVIGTNQQRGEAIEYLLKYHVEWAEDPLVVMETIAGDGISDLLGEDAAEESSTYPTLTSTTLPCYYRGLMTGLVSQIKTIPSPSKKKTPTIEEYMERFHVLELSAKVLYILVNIVKSFERRSVLSSALKYGRVYVEHFIRSGMPVIHHLFRSRKDDVMAMLKTIQQSTRLLHHFCSHSKVAKDIALTNHVPPCKRSLEMLVFTVKELLSAHNCAEAFWVGNLKNRDIRGQEILSQSSQNNTTCREEDNEEEEEEGRDGEPCEEGSSTTTTSVSRRDQIIETDSETEERED